MEEKNKKVRVYELSEMLFNQVINYIVNSKSDFTSGSIAKLLVSLDSIKPIEREIKQQNEQENKQENKK